jgi:hypothetical protein
MAIVRCVDIDHIGRQQCPDFNGDVERFVAAALGALQPPAVEHALRFFLVRSEAHGNTSDGYATLSATHATLIVCPFESI